MKRTKFFTVLSVIAIFALLLCIVQSLFVSPLKLDAKVVLKSGFKEMIDGTSYCFCSDTKKECLPCYVIIDPEPIQ